MCEVSVHVCVCMCVCVWRVYTRVVSVHVCVCVHVCEQRKMPVAMGYMQLSQTLL